MLDRAVAALARPHVVAAGGMLDWDVLLDAVRDELESGPLAGEEIHDFLDDSVDELLDDAVADEECPLRLLAGARVVDVGWVVERLVLTHRLTEAEVCGATLDLTLDLAGLVPVAQVDGGLHTGEGVPLLLRKRRLRGAGRAGGTLYTACLEGPAGWLEAFAPGTLVAVRARSGFLELEAVAKDAPVRTPAGVGRHLGALFDLLNEGDGLPVWGEDLQLLAALEHPDWFARPTRPFGELVEAAGFEVDGRFVGRPGTWEDHRRILDVAATVTRHHLRLDEYRLLTDALSAFDAWGEGRVPTGLGARFARHWAAAEALLEELRRRGADGATLGRFGEAVGPPLEGWLRARAAALEGRTEEAEALAREAAAVHPSFGPAVAEAAWYAADRGRYQEAVNLLHRVRHAEDPELSGLREWARVFRAAPRRNDPCPCGSGRKAKHCHRDQPPLPVVQRVRALLDKARRYVEEVAPPELIDDFVNEVADRDGGVELGLDLLLFDVGWLERFVEARGVLLPVPEAEWARHFGAEQVSSVFRVGARVDGEGRVELEDVVTGERRTVEPSPLLEGVTVDRLVWARLVPVGDRWCLTGVLRRVGLRERDRLLEELAPGRDARARLEALLPEPASPQLQNASGDPLVFCTTTLVVGPEAAARLDEHLGRRGDEPEWCTEEDTPGMRDAVTATFRLVEGDRLVVETNSIRRHDAALELVGRLLGDPEVVVEERTPVARIQAWLREETLARVARAMLGAEDEEPADGEDLGDDAGFDEEGGPHPAVAAMLEAHEERWLDLPLPALGGRSPREAAADEVARRDLRTLLAEMEDTPGLMDIRRLRHTLDLPTG